MRDQLTNAEKDFLKIFKCYEVLCDECLIPGNIIHGSRKFLTTPDRDKVHDIIKSLIRKGYAYEKESHDALFLTKKGEDFIY